MGGREKRLLRVPEYAQGAEEKVNTSEWMIMSF